MDTVGTLLRQRREERRLSLEEISRETKIPVAQLSKLESDTLDGMPADIFVRGFLKAYARAVGLAPEVVLERHVTGQAETEWTPPVTTLHSMPEAPGSRFGVAIAFVLLLVLFTLGLSIVLKPRGRDVPQELSRVQHGQHGRGATTLTSPRIA